jgi:prepilin-type N-terminal cleavage/methylation domain-containing protein
MLRVPHRPAVCASHPPRGFTFLEIIIVALVLAILAVNTVPQFGPTANRLRAEQALGELAQLMRYASHLAVFERRTVIWSWKEDERLARLEHELENGDRRPVEARLNQTQALSKALEVQAFDAEALPVLEVAFYADGTSESAYVTVRYEKKVYTAHVDATTSQVEISEGAPTF